MKFLTWPKRTSVMCLLPYISRGTSHISFSELLQNQTMPSALKSNVGSCFCVFTLIIPSIWDTLLSLPSPVSWRTPTFPLVFRQTLPPLWEPSFTLPLSALHRIDISSLCPTPNPILCTSLYRGSGITCLHVSLFTKQWALKDGQAGIPSTV